MSVLVDPITSGDIYNSLVKEQVIITINSSTNIIKFFILDLEQSGINNKR